MLRRLMRGSRLALGVTLLVGGFFGCSDTTAEKLRLAELSQGCLINSDCAEPLVCAFQRCHVECQTSRDCAAGERCVAGDRPFRVCLLEDEISCATALPCPGPLVCGEDLECRDSCASSGDCIPGQLCERATCVDPEELDDDGRLPTSARDESLPLVCNYHSDCPAPNVCRAGTCVRECDADVDCDPHLACSEGRCIVEAGAECRYHSECDAEQLCVHGSCTTAPDPAECAYASDCDIAGQICSDGRCLCSCADDTDCDFGFVCNGCGCVPVTVIEGNYTINNTRDAERLAGVVEIRGTLSISVPSTDRISELTIGSVERVERLSVQFSGDSLRLPALEEIAGDVVIQNTDLGQEFSVPKLRSVAGNLQVFNLESLQELSFPSLETVGGALTMSSNYALVRVGAPHLVDVASVQMSFNAELQRVSMPLLETAKTVEFATNAALTELDLPSLRELDVLSLAQNPIDTLDLPELEIVRQHLAVLASPIETVALPKLHTAGALRLHDDAELDGVDVSRLTTLGGTSASGDLFIQNCDQLATLEFPVLEGNTGKITVDGNELLETVEFPLVTSAQSLLVRANPELHMLAAPLVDQLGDGGLLVSDCDSLAQVDFPLLSSAGGLTLNGNAALQSASFPALQAAGALDLIDNPSLPTFSLPALATMPNSGTVSVSGNQVLTSLSAPLLSNAGNVSFDKNPQLSSIDFSALASIDSVIQIRTSALTDLDSLNPDIAGSLTSVGLDVTIETNPSLPVCAVDALLTALTNRGFAGSSSNTGNLACTCNGPVCQ